ncbi:MAG: formylglycine-generating enzyme family protein [Candidatus Riflebacteria bacterium]|nr:formylglycine-generating enzyme family protein [Candidatus Riflebacteria bacterium]
MKKAYLTIFFILTILFASYGEESNNLYIKDINLEMIECPAGSFNMGSKIEEHIEEKKFLDEFDHKKDCGFDYSENLHLVTLTKPFYIGKYEVTQKQYLAIMGNNPSKFIGDNNPVERVTYDDAKSFCEKLNQKYSNILPKGYKFDLPTEAQWEYACRAGTNTALNNSKDLTRKYKFCPNLEEVAWYFENSRGTVHEVGQLKQNAWGIYDMHGNVSEWCNDWYGTYPENNTTDPKGPNFGTYKVLRGGTWAGNSGACRSAFRGHKKPMSSNRMTGFRVAIVPVMDNQE